MASSTMLCHLFKDHQNKPALSAIFPVPAQLQLQPINKDEQESGYVETVLNYPCFQIYQITNTFFSLDNRSGQSVARKWLAQIMYMMKVAGFFTGFEGIRFELYDGRPEFRQYLESGQHNRGFTRSIREHSLGERENRNILACFHNAIFRYSETRSSVQHERTRVKGLNQIQLHQIMVSSQQTLECVCDMRARFCAPLVPNSFICPPLQPWHNVVILLSSNNLVKDGLLLYRFGREPPVHDPELITEGPRHECQRVYIDLRNGERSCHLPSVLGRHLHLLGLSNALNTRNGLRPGFDEDLSFWFTGSWDATRANFSLPDDSKTEEELQDLTPGHDAAEYSLVISTPRDQHLNRKEDKDWNGDVEMTGLV